MILPYFESLASGIESKLAALAPDEPVARKRFALEIARLGVRLFSGRERLAWCGVLAPFDLLHGLGVTSCFTEFVGAMLASTGGVEPMLEAAEGRGYSTDCCGYHRAVTGAMLQELMPRPDFLIATTAPCSGGLALNESLARHFARDLFVIDVPNRGPDESSVAYLADQLRAMTRFVEEHTGEPADPGRIGAAIERSNQARELLLEVYGLARARPSPARRRDLFNFGLVVSLLLGSQSAVEVARTYRDEFRRRVEAGVGGAPGERVRLMWLQNRIQFRSPLEEALEGLGAAVVVDELNAVTWDAVDPADPYPGLARRILTVPLVGAVDRRIALLRRLARDYQVDGAINPCHWGCRQGSGARGLIEAGLRQAGVPVLNLEVDCIDPRNFAPGQLATRLEAFLELIRARAGG
jgi:benzoyl-CoA reductase/2-hydroxyglutaryl-CoA dehydratase subunit BcrC/BadD/HgdB